MARERPKSGAERTRLLQAALACVALLAVAEVAARFAVPRLTRMDSLYDHRALVVKGRSPRSDEPILWLIGDSTVAGLDVERHKTPGALLGERFGPCTDDDPSQEAPCAVRAVAVPGMGLDNTRELLADLPLWPGDRVLVSVHLGLIDTYRDIGYTAASGPWQDRAEHHATRLFQPLALMRYREYLRRVPVLLAQAALPERYAFALRRTKPGPLRRAEWTDGDLGQRDLRSLQRRYGEVEAETAAMASEKLAAIAQDLVEQEVEVLAYVAPLNRIIMDLYGYAKWSTIVDVADSLCEKAPVPCTNLTEDVPGELFYDDDHLTEEGYEILVERLVEELQSTF